MKPVYNIKWRKMRNLFSLLCHLHTIHNIQIIKETWKVKNCADEPTDLPTHQADNESDEMKWNGTKRNEWKKRSATGGVGAAVTAAVFP